MEWRRIDRKRVAWWNPVTKQFASLFDDLLKAILKEIKENGLNESRIASVIHQSADDWEMALGKVYRDVITDFADSVKPIKSQRDRQRLDESIGGFIRKNSGKKIKGIQEETVKRVNALLLRAKEESATVSEVQQDLVDMNMQEMLEDTVRTGLIDLYDSFSISRSLTIARTEVGAASGFGQMEFGAIAGFTQKVWMTSRHGHVRDSHQMLDNDATDMEGVFPNGLAYPCDPNAPSSGEMINCRCALSFHDSAL